MAKNKNYYKVLGEGKACSLLKTSQIDPNGHTTTFLSNLLTRPNGCILYKGNIFYVDQQRQACQLIARKENNACYYDSLHQAMEQLNDETVIKATPSHLTYITEATEHSLPIKASKQEITQAYRVLARIYHPDRGGDVNRAKFQEIANAYEHLSDKDKREVYDQSNLNEASDEARRKAYAQSNHNKASDEARRKTHAQSNHNKATDDARRKTHAHSNHNKATDDARRKAYEQGNYNKAWRMFSEFFPLSEQHQKSPPNEYNQYMDPEADFTKEDKNSIAYEQRSRRYAPNNMLVNDCFWTDTTNSQRTLKSYRKYCEHRSFSKKSFASKIDEAQKESESFYFIKEEFKKYILSTFLPYQDRKQIYQALFQPFEGLKCLFWGLCLMVNLLGMLYRVLCYEYQAIRHFLMGFAYLIMGLGLLLGLLLVRTLIFFVQMPIRMVFNLPYQGGEKIYMALCQSFEGLKYSFEGLCLMVNLNNILYSVLDDEYEGTNNFLLGLTLLAIGLGKLLTTPFTWFVQMPIRAGFNLLRQGWGRIEDGYHIQRIIAEAEKALVSGDKRGCIMATALLHKKFELNVGSKNRVTDIDCIEEKKRYDMLDKDFVLGTLHVFSKAPVTPMQKTHLQSYLSLFKKIPHYRESNPPSSQQNYYSTL